MFLHSIQQFLEVKKGSSVPFPEHWDVINSIYKNQGKALSVLHLITSVSAFTWCPGQPDLHAQYFEPVSSFAYFIQHLGFQLYGQS